MFSGKIFFTLIGIVLAILAICKFDFSSPNLVENWDMGSQTVTARPYLISSNGSKTAFSGNYFDPGNINNMRGSDKFVSVPNFQGVLSPRFSNVQYGANIRYNMPDRENLGTPCNPLSFGDMATENYKKPSQVKENYGCNSGQCGSSSPSCGKGGYGIGHKIAGGYDVPPGYTNGNYSDVYNSLPSDSNFTTSPCSDPMISSSLPVGSMSTMDSVGNPEQFVVMNRLMNTNMKSRLRGQGDWIRGDLAITPCSSGWFSVYPTINTDLNPGALNVMAGHQAGESNSKLMELLINSSGGARTTFGGVNFDDAPKVNMTPQYSSVLSAANTDVQVTSFP